MPYRVAAYEDRCRVCGELTALRCCKCGSRVCGDHARELALQFFVRTVACTDEARCHPPKREPKRYEPDDEIIGPYGLRIAKR